ncbi:MAG: TMEM175 family protein [Telluria sp.]
MMVLELKAPHGAGFDVLVPLLPILGSYILSFIYVGIYWNKHRYGCHPYSTNNVDAQGA